MYSLKEVIDLAAKSSPELEEKRSGKEAAEAAVKIARASYLPQVDFQVTDSAGFPGSSGMTGVGGIMGSPFRSGYAYGFALKQRLWDFGRTAGEESAAISGSAAESADLQLSTYQIKVRAMRAFFDCSLQRSQVDAWKLIRQEAETVAGEVSSLVGTGQRSVVEKYLVQAQVEEARTNELGFSERVRGSLRRLSILTGETNERICPLLPKTLPLESSPLDSKSESNVFIGRADAERKIAHAKLSQAKAGHLPYLVGVASLGAFENTRLVPEKNYSVGIGVVIPLFDGLRTTADVQRAEALEAKSEHARDTVLQQTALLESDWSASVDSSRVRFQHLTEEQSKARMAVSIARKRYFAHQGTLVDLRESLRNLGRTFTLLNEASADYWISNVTRTLFKTDRESSP